MELSEGSLFAERYIIRRLLGHGAFSRVYLARNEEKLVVLKILPIAPCLSAAKCRLFQGEGKVLGRLNHPNIPRVYDVGSLGLVPGLSEGILYVAMEYFVGESLRDWLLAHPNATLEQLFKIFTLLFEGVQAAHEQGIVHRDLKPENILIREEGDGFNIRIIDFGIALPTGTMPEIVVGTAEYAAPEQMEGHPAAPHADQFSLGILVYEALTRSLPRRGRRGWHVEQSLSQVIPLEVFRPDLPPWISIAVQRALAFDPAQRHANVREFFGALQGLSPIVQVTSTDQPYRWRIVASLALLSLGFLSLLAWLLTHAT